MTTTTSSKAADTGELSVECARLRQLFPAHKNKFGTSFPACNTWFWSSEGKVTLDQALEALDVKLRN